MAAKRGFGVPFASILLVAGFLVLLAYLPNWLRKRQFSFPSDPSPAAAAEKVSFPMDHSFPVVAGNSRLPGTLKAKKQVTLAELSAQSQGGLIVNFWATWCPPCLDELPGLDYLNRQLALRTKDKLPILVTISVDESPQDVSGLFETLDFTPSLIVLHDPNGDFSASLGTTRFPETYWVDASGKVRHKWIGPQNWLSEDVLTTLLNQIRI